MPSKDDTGVGVDAKDYIGSDVEDLVAAIKEKLRLKTRSCHALYTKQNRTSPYKVPMRTNNKCRQCFEDLTQCQSTGLCRICSLKPKTQARTEITDPYDLLQELIREGTLIQEAVKRLQLGLPNKSKGINYYDDYDEVSSTASSTTPYEL